MIRIDHVVETVINNMVAWIIIVRVYSCFYTFTIVEEISTTLMLRTTEIASENVSLYGWKHCTAIILL